VIEDDDLSLNILEYGVKDILECKIKDSCQYHRMSKIKEFLEEIFKRHEIIDLVLLEKQPKCMQQINSEVQIGINMFMTSMHSSIKTEEIDAKIKLKLVDDVIKRIDMKGRTSHDKNKNYVLTLFNKYKIQNGIKTDGIKPKLENNLADAFMQYVAWKKFRKPAN
jgi:hypothetical protein